MCHHAGDLPGRSRTGPNPRARRTPGVRAGRAGPAPRRRLASSASPQASREARASGRARCPPPQAPPPAPAQVRNEREPGRLGCTLLRYNGARGREFRTLAGPTRRRGPTEILGLGPGGDASSSRPPPLTPLTERLFPKAALDQVQAPRVHRGDWRRDLLFCETGGPAAEGWGRTGAWVGLREASSGETVIPRPGGGRGGRRCVRAR